jgi:adenylate kinase
VAGAAEPSRAAAPSRDGAPEVGAQGGGGRIVFLGPPNSGKGTQAKIVAGRLGEQAISTGEMLSEAVEEGSPLGRQVAEILDAGELVDDATMARVVGERLARRDTARGFLLDGYPRTLAQAETLERVLDERGEGLDVALLIDAPEDELVARALGRGRPDDREEVLRERLRVYRERTAPLVGYYEERGLLRRVDGDHPVEEVTSRIFAELRVPKKAIPKNAMARG